MIPTPLKIIEHEGTYQVYAADGSFVAQFGALMEGQPPDKELKPLVELFVRVANART